MGQSATPGEPRQTPLYPGRVERAGPTTAAALHAQLDDLADVFEAIDLALANRWTQAAEMFREFWVRIIELGEPPAPPSYRRPKDEEKPVPKPKKRGGTANFKRM